jgi:hypothetical protein
LLSAVLFFLSAFCLSTASAHTNLFTPGILVSADHAFNCQPTGLDDPPTGVGSLTGSLDAQVSSPICQADFRFSHSLLPGDLVEDAGWDRWTYAARGPPPLASLLV